ncbi:MAG: HAD-IB family phosphatase [Deltaproteobacteria bacterium]|nr:HAD-IB family phosphatase [Deltaproteobacteria bacterium]
MQGPIDSRSSRVLVLVDFDGTLTESDGDFQVADALLGPERQGAWKPLAEAYERLELSAAGYFTAWLDLLQLERPMESITRAGAAIPLRAGADALMDYCRQRGLGVRIASEGLDAYVRPALQAAGLSSVDLSCNRLVEHPDGCQVLSAIDAGPCSRCLSCKAFHVRRARELGMRVIVVGDGASDLCGARLADVVIARGSLAEHCAREQIAYLPWQSLQDVVDAIGSSLEGDPA